jgi:hypothetical protein
MNLLTNKNVTFRSTAPMKGPTKIQRAWTWSIHALCITRSHKLKKFTDQTRNFSTLPADMKSMNAEQNNTFKIGVMKLMDNIPDNTKSDRGSSTVLIHPLFILQNIHRVLSEVQS